MFDIPYVADWSKIGEYRQEQTDINTARENKRRSDFDYVVGGKVLLKKMASSAKLRAGTLAHIPFYKFIRTVPLGFNADLYLKD